MWRRVARHETCKSDIICLRVLVRTLHGALVCIWMADEAYPIRTSKRWGSGD